MVNFQDFWVFWRWWLCDYPEDSHQSSLTQCSFPPDRLTPSMYNPKFKQLRILGGLRLPLSVSCVLFLCKIIQGPGAAQPACLQASLYLVCREEKGEDRRVSMKVSGLDSGSGQHCRNLYSIGRVTRAWGPPYRCDWAEKLHFLTSHVRKEPM